MSQRSLARRVHNAWFISLGSLAAVALLVGLLFWNPEKQSAASSKAPLLVYCAAGLKTPVAAIARDYEKEYGIPVELDFDNSEGLLNRLAIAQRGDLYLPADDSYLDKAENYRLQGQKLDLVDETIDVVRMRPVLVVKKGNPKKIEGLADLVRTDVELGLANPNVAAVSAVVRKLLNQTGEWENLEKHARVVKPTVTDLANDIKLGTVDAGFIWDAMLRQYPDLEAVEVPALKAAVAHVKAGVLKSAKYPTTALRFARYLSARDKGLVIFRENGYEPVEGDDWAETPKLVLFSGAMLRTAIQDTLKSFETREGVEIDWVYNGCGILIGQLKNPKTRCDGYFSCDMPFMTSPVAQERFPKFELISENEVVILVDKGNPKAIKGLKDLTRPGLQIGVCHPEKSALGRRVEQMFEEAGLLEALRESKNVAVESAAGDTLVNQLRLSRHSLDAVVVFRSNAAGLQDELDIVELNTPSARALQPFAVSKDTRHKQLMNRLLRALKSAESKDRFESLGFKWRVRE